MFQASERALHDGGLRIREPRGPARPVRAKSQRSSPRRQRTAAAEHDAAVDQVGDQVGAALVERGADAIDDAFQRIGQGLGHFARADFDAARQAGGDVDAADVGRRMGSGEWGMGTGGSIFGLIWCLGIAAEFDAELFGGGEADAEAALAAEVFDDGLVHPIAADADGVACDDIAEAEDGDFGGAGADVDDHAGHRFGDGEADAESRWERSWRWRS